jgi:Subtilase family
MEAGEDLCMQAGERGRLMRKLRAGALALFGLAAVAIAVSFVSDASAIDLPNHARKAGKAAVPGKGPALGKGPGLNKGAVSKGPALSKGQPLNNVQAQGKGPALGKGQGLSKGTELSKGGALTKGGLSKGNQPAFNQHQPTALSNRGTTFPRAGQRRDWSRATPREYRQFQAQHRQAIFAARARLPFRPLPGMRGFTGVPPVGETRFVSNEMVFHVGSGVSQQTIDAAVRRLGLSTVASQSIGLTGGTLFHFRVADGRQVSEVVRALEAENIGTAQPNYVYTLQQDATQEDPTLAGRTEGGDPGQYVVSKLRLGEVHRITTGSNVLVAVIDSAIDIKHPDLAGTVVEQFDAVGRPDAPHSHGTGMAGAIVAHRKLMGIAPGARILAIHAFSPDAKESPQATTEHILAGIEWAIKKGARVINMSFAGPYDPLLQLAMKNAHDKGVVLIAAAGNAGPNSPPLYPAADPNVIAVTATDENDQLFPQANQGPQVAVAAPGVNILEPAPNGGYQVTTGTSVAAAHVSGIVALLLGRNPGLDPAAINEILTSSAKNPEGDWRDDKFGWGVVDPTQALLDLDAKVADDQRGNPAGPVAANPPAAAKPVAANPAAAKPAAPKPASAKSAPVFAR